MVQIDIQRENNKLLQIQKGDRKLLKKLYEEYRSAFIAWTKKRYDVNDDLASEIYQKAFIAFYYNIREGKITALKSSLKTYLFAIGRNQLRDQFKMNKKFVDQPESADHDMPVDASVMKKYEQQDLKEKISQLLNTIGEPCRTVLTLFYFRHFSMEAIAEYMDYSSRTVAAKRKFICLKQLRGLIDNA